MLLVLTRREATIAPVKMDMLVMEGAVLVSNNISFSMKIEFLKESPYIHNKFSQRIKRGNVFDIILETQVKVIIIIFILDVNECATKSHSCHADAVCHNTKGSYRCACKTGYVGNGKTCDGKYNKRYL